MHKSAEPIRPKQLVSSRCLASLPRASCFAFFCWGGGALSGNDPKPFTLLILDACDFVPVLPLCSVAVQALTGVGGPGHWCLGL